MRKIIVGNALSELRKLPSESVHCCVTSPPYWGLRDYGIEGQLGLQKTPNEYVENLVDVLQEVERVLRKDGTLWLNLGDSYAQGGSGGASNKSTLKNDGRPVYGARSYEQSLNAKSMPRKAPPGFKAKDLVGIPWRVAFALQAQGWYLRQDIIWHKPNPMPESVRDRCTKAHEYIFLLSKSERYFFDIEAIKEPAKYGGPNGSIKSPYGQGFSRSGNKYRKQRPGAETLRIGAQAGSVPWHGNTKQKRSVWTVTTKPFKGAHFATFPPDLIEPCILAGCPVGGTVLDPFFGAGTTGVVSVRNQRNFIGIELNPEYAKIAEERISEMGVLL